MSNLDEAIRERAYHLWLKDGRPEGQADLYWLNAQRDLLSASVEAIAAPFEPEVTKPTKKPRMLRIRKSKSKTA
jgi:hypothetical protein